MVTNYTVGLHKNNILNLLINMPRLLYYRNMVQLIYIKLQSTQNCISYLFSKSLMFLLSHLGHIETSHQLKNEIKFIWRYSSTVFSNDSTEYPSWY